VVLGIGTVQSDELAFVFLVKKGVLVSSFAPFVRSPSALAHLQPLGC
jgi:hypothetical protein